MGDDIGRMAGRERFARITPLARPQRQNGRSASGGSAAVTCAEVGQMLRELRLRRGLA
jgi:hypothetical protein